MKNLSVTSLDPDDIKSSLIDFIQSKEGFEDIDYEGSAINTIIDLLTFNNVMSSYQANMLANESFLDSAKIRKNVSSHAQKLSYVPKSRTSSRLMCKVSVTPPASSTDLPNSIVMEPNTQFIGSVGDDSFTFTNTKTYILPYSNSTGQFSVDNVVLNQGQLLSETFFYTPGQKITIENKNIDTDTLILEVDGVQFFKATSIRELDSQANVYFLSESYSEKYQVEFGKNILGLEPDNNAEITVRYIATEDDHANGVTSLISGSTIGGFPNISVNVTSKSYAGADKQDIDEIRFIAPKIYQAQDRALTDTDYVPLIKQRFPFVRSVITWGGENNDPPQYGSVFISILSDIGTVTNAVKQDIVAYLQSRNVGSVTPTIVDPVRFFGDLTIEFSYDNRLTSKSFNDLQADIKTVIDKYNEDISDFDKFFNKSEVISKIRDINGITIVNLFLTVVSNNNVLLYENPVYEIKFGNTIVKESVSVKDIKILNGLDAEIYDDGEGDIRISYTTSSNVVDKSIGSVDYETGVVEFIVNINDSVGDFDVVCKVENDNFFVKQNRVFEINNSTIELLPNRRFNR